MIYFTQSEMHLGQILTSEVIAVEVVGTLVGSIGLIASVPITTALAAFVVTRPHVDASDDHGHDRSHEGADISRRGGRLNRQLIGLKDAARRRPRPGIGEPGRRRRRAEKPWQPSRWEREMRDL